jgi:hypothetical protein
VICYNPVVYGYQNSITSYAYNYLPGVLLPEKAYTYFPNVSLKLTLYGGNADIVDQGTYSSNVVGFISRNYTILGTEGAGTWHLVASDPAAVVPATYQAADASYLDDSPVTVVLNAPTPIFTPACANMPAMFADKAFSMEQYRFRYRNCTTFFYELRWPAPTNPALLAVYDGAGDLTYTAVLDTVNSYKTHYHVQATEAAGIWHAVLYKTTSTPPAVYAGAGDYGPCIPDRILVTLY